MSRLKNIISLFLSSKVTRGKARLVRKSGVFDRAFYRGVNPLLHPVHKFLAERHYLVFGEAAGLQPNPDFSPKAYFKHNADLVGQIDSPLLHFIENGQHEGRVCKDVTGGLATVDVHMPKVRRLNQPKKNYAIVVHVYYHDLWDEITALLAQQDFDFDLFVTFTYAGDETDALMAHIKDQWPAANLYPMPNHGRDIFPFVHLVNSGALNDYKAICKIHTKRSPHRQDGDHWRQHLMQGILPPTGTRALIEKFIGLRDYGIWVADGQHYTGAKWWGSNQEKTAAMMRRIETLIDPNALSFPAGSMYWLKPLMVQMIKGMQLDHSSFDPEQNQTDGTQAHAFERVLGYIAQTGGYNICQTTELNDHTDPDIALPQTAYVSAFYLPQFHPIPENDAWWGTGFTEWRAVTKAAPVLTGQVHPMLPADLGFYDLRLPETMGQQWAMAKDAGIDAFCVYHYWFNGDRLLETPLEGLLGRPDVDFSFYLCWANETWRRNWDGLSGEILIEQKYEDGFEADLAKDAQRYFDDPRYARPDGTRPRFVLYRPEDMPDPAGAIGRMRAAWHALGVGDVEIGAVRFHIPGDTPLPHDLVDFWVEMPPHGVVTQDDYLYGGPDGNRLGIEVSPAFEGLAYTYSHLAKNSQSKAYTKALPDKTIAGIMPCWDNTARRGMAAHMAYGGNPASFRKWLISLKTNRVPDSYRHEIMINAWNEWAEKAILEPSQQYGSAYLEVLKDTV